MLTIEERVADLRKSYPSVSDEALRASIIEADKAREARKNRNKKIKDELVAKGGQEPIGAKPETAKPETPKPKATFAKGARPDVAHAVFVINAIRVLRRPPFKGIHSVYSGLNRNFGLNYGLDKAQTIEAIGKVVASGVVSSRPVKGGIMLYIPGEMPGSTRDDDVLGKILGD